MLAVFLLTAISCKKQNDTTQSSAITSESLTQDLSTDIDEVAKIISVKIGSQQVQQENDFSPWL
jgi:hypothetical protein